LRPWIGGVVLFVALLWLAFCLAGVVDRRYEDIGGQKQFIGPTQRFLSARRNDAER
jgi:hypothetical protein